MKILPIVLAVCVLSAVAVAAQPFDLTGDWLFDVQTDAGGGTPSIVLVQKGDTLTGKYKGALGEADVTGTVTGNKVTFSFSGDAQGTAITVTYDGEIESASSIKGKVDLGGLASGTFSGKRIK